MQKASLLAPYWEEIEQVKKDYPDMYVTFTEKDNRKANLWLPAKIIDEIRWNKQ